jgi:anti-sigma B factor antagonist
MRPAPEKILGMGERGSMPGFVAGLALGALGGATLAMILAPQTGEETRDVLLAKAREAGERARDTAADANDLLARGRTIVADANRRRGQRRQGRSFAAARHPPARNVGEALDIKVNVRESEGDAYVVDLTGEIDVYTSPKVKDAITELIDQEHYNLVINLEKVRYIDSTGLGVLIGGLKRVREHGGSVNLVCTNPQIKKIFDITGLVKIFGIFDDEQSAMKALV